MRIRSLLSVAVLAALLVGCGSAQSSGGGAAATVDGHEIPRERLEDAVVELAGDTSDLEAAQRNEALAATQRQVLGFLIQAQVILNVADERGIEVSDAEAQERYERDLEQFGSEEGLAQALNAQQSGLTPALYREVLIPASLRLDAIRSEVADLSTRTVRHILVETEPEAQAIVDELAEGADFAELAQERSTDPGSGERGGDLGAAPRGSYVPGFEDAVWSAEVGEVVGPVESQFGFHVLEVTDTGTLDPDDPRTAQVGSAEIDQMLSEAFAAADVSIAPGLGEWDPEMQQVVAPDRVGEGAPSQPLMPDATDPLEESGDAPAGE